MNFVFTDSKPKRVTHSSRTVSYLDQVSYEGCVIIHLKDFILGGCSLQSVLRPIYFVPVSALLVVVGTFFRADCHSHSYNHM